MRPYERPTKIVAVHLNYRSRAAERGKEPVNPSYFLKATSTLSAHDTPVVRPAGCTLLAYEGEIALVLRDVPRNTSQADAWSFVASVTAANDFGVYDLRYADPGSNVHSKGWDGFTPIGPTWMRASNVDPDSLRVRTWVNGNAVQDADSSDLIFGPEFVIADLSRVLTLAAGDLILMGTPTGSSVTVPDDVVEVEVTAQDGLTSGRLRNRIVEGGVRIGGPGAFPRADQAATEAAYGAAHRRKT